MKLHGPVEVFLDVAVSSTAAAARVLLLLVLITGGSAPVATAALVPGEWHMDNTLIDGPGSCPTGSTCVRPLRCTAAMELFWNNLTMSEECDSEDPPSPLEKAFKRCWIVTEAENDDRAEYEGICCRMDPLLENDGRQVEDSDDSATDDDSYFDSQDYEEEQVDEEQETESNDINRGRSSLESVTDYDQLIGSDFPSLNESYIRVKRCLIGPECAVKHYRYRRYDGKCNNIGPGKSLWGSAGYPMERVLPPVYGDGVSSPRVLSQDGRYLTSSRVISDKLFPDLHIPHRKHNVLMMQFGQFVTHDVSKNKPAATDAKCCTPDDSRREPNPAPACFPIRVSSRDSFYSQFNVKCMQYVRTAMAPRDLCPVGHGRQISDVTHFIDGSQIYGSSEKVAKQLRSLQGGRMKSIEHRHTHYELLPLEEAKGACTSQAKACFKAGDNRVNQVITLTAVHTLFLREHNRIAKMLEKMNPHWNDEILFQETRRIVSAELQHIVYNEYLPKVVGPHFMDMYDLHTSRGYSKFYNPFKNPAITSEFSGAAFRFGHSTVPGQFAFPKVHVKTHDTFFDPSLLAQPKFFDELFYGIMTQPMEQTDAMFTHSVTWFLNPEEGRPYGRDLAAINMQRGRDYAIQPYNSYLKLSGRKPMRSFSDFGPVNGEKLNKLYPSPNDVDLYVGGILEQPVPGGVVGPMFAEIISDQFARFKQGDRYFYSNGPHMNPGHFTKLQLQEVQKMTLAGVLCANSDDKKNFRVTQEALNLPHAEKNPFVSCRSKFIPRLNLRWWKD